MEVNVAAQIRVVSDDTAFPREGALRQKMGCQPIICSKFSSKCMQMKEIGQKGGSVHPQHPLDRPVLFLCHFRIQAISETTLLLVTLFL